MFVYSIHAELATQGDTLAHLNAEAHRWFDLDNIVLRTISTDQYTTPPAL
jgi:hypothetical protein